MNDIKQTQTISQTASYNKTGSNMWPERLAACFLNIRHNLQVNIDHNSLRHSLVRVCPLQAFNCQKMCLIYLWVILIISSFTQRKHCKLITSYQLQELLRSNKIENRKQETSEGLIHSPVTFQTVNFSKISNTQCHVFLHYGHFSLYRFNFVLI